VGWVDAVLDNLIQGLKHSFLNGLRGVVGARLRLLISAIVQAWVPRQKIENALSGSGARPIALATGPRRPLRPPAPTPRSRSPNRCVRRARRPPPRSRFSFASTNLVWELGLVLWVLIGWQFTLAEYVGGIVMIVITTILLRLFISPQLEEIARRNAREADTGHQHHMAASEELDLASARHPCGLVVRRRAQLPRRLADALQGDHDRVFFSPGSSACSATGSSTRCSSSTPPPCPGRSRT